MNLKVDLDMLLWAFESSDVSNHFYIDTEKNEIINVNEYLGDDIGKLDEIDHEKCLKIPDRFPNDDFNIIELFIYDIVEDDFSLADDFYQVFDKPKPFRRFKDLLEIHPEIKDKWFKYKDNYIKNELINWLFEKGIILENQKLIPEIIIKEVDQIEKLPEDIKGFTPVGCLECNNKSGLKPRFFLLNIEIENKMIDNDVKRIMKELFNVNHYGMFTSDNGDNILTVSKCPKCGSDDVFWDY